MSCHTEIMEITEKCPLITGVISVISVISV